MPLHFFSVYSFLRQPQLMGRNFNNDAKKKMNVFKEIENFFFFAI